MLTGNRAKYYAIIFGVAFASMLMTQQASIFVGLMRNTASQIRDIQGADIWVMDPSVQFVDDIKPLTENDLYRVRGVPGVAWAVRLYKGMSQAQLDAGNFKQFSVIGLDEQTLVGAPAEMILGYARRPSPGPTRSFSTSAATSFLFPGQPLQHRLGGGDERPPGGGGGHLQEFAVFPDVPDRLHALQPGADVRAAGAATDVVHPGRLRAGRLDGGSGRPHPRRQRLARP